MPSGYAQGDNTRPLALPVRHPPILTRPSDPCPILTRPSDPHPSAC